MIGRYIAILALLALAGCAGVGRELGLANDLFDQGRYREAAESYRQVLRQRPGDQEATLLLAYILFAQLGHYDEALALLKAGQANKAVFPLAEALLQYRQDRTHPTPAHLQLGASLDSQQRYHEALAEYRTAAQLSPTNPQAQAGQALMQFRLKRYPEAIEADRRALKLAPRDPMVLYNLADALALSGRKDAAMDVLDRMLALKPNMRPLVSDETALQSLHDEPRFQQLTAPRCARD